MATAVVTVDTECPVCFEGFKSELNIPKILNCGHTVCLECLNHISDYKCPQCREVFLVPPGGLDQFPTVFVLISNSSSSEKCPNHSYRDVDYYCSDCRLGLCFKCIQLTHKDHSYIDLEDKSTRSNIMSKITDIEKVIRRDIKNYEKNNQEIKEISEDIFNKYQTSLTTVTDILKTNFEDNKSRLEGRKRRNDQQLNNLRTSLQKLSNLAESSNFQLMKMVSNLYSLHKRPSPPPLPNMNYLKWQTGPIRAEESSNIKGHLIQMELKGGICRIQ